MTAATPSRLDAPYVSNPDPWGCDSRWYESRKRQLVLASLPDRHYGEGYEPGCGTGALTSLLASRCAHLLASDGSAVAAESARRRLADAANAAVVQAMIPRDWPRPPDGGFDLIVLSEICYYLSETQFAGVLARIGATLSPQGTLVACHWRRHADPRLRDSSEVHRRLGALPGMHAIASHLEQDFLLDVWCGDPRSVACRETGNAA